MYIIKIEAFNNGGHANQSWHNIDFIPEGYALIPKDMTLPASYPFVDIEVEEANGISTVTSMTKREVPEPEPIPYTPTIDDRVSTLESQLEETDEITIQLYEASLAQDEAIIELYETLGGINNG